MHRPRTSLTLEEYAAKRDREQKAMREELKRMIARTSSPEAKKAAIKAGAKPWRYANSNFGMGL